MNHTMSSLRRFLAPLLSLSLAIFSVEPAFSQVRALAVESLAVQAGHVAPPSISAAAAGALNRPASLSIDGLSSPFALAPALSAASLPVSAAAVAAPPAASIAALPTDSSARESAATLTNAPAAGLALAPVPASRQSLSSLEALAQSAVPKDAESDNNGSAFFDFAKHPIASAFAIAGFTRGAGSRLEPSDAEAASHPAPDAALPPSPAPSKTRSVVSKILWGAGALALPVLTFGWMSFLKSPAANDASATSHFTDWSAIVRGVAFAGPLLIIAVWEAVKLIRSKKPGALPWMSRLQWASALHKSILPRLNHYMTNLAFGAVGIAMIAIFAGPHIDDFNHFLNAHNVGLLRWLHVGGWKNVVAGLTMLDFLGWWWHYACHRFPLMWRLHKVHHSDIEYNFSTTYRTHWAEMAAEILGRMAMYALVGPSLLTITINEIIILGLAQYQHANIKMPARLEAIMSRVFMTSHKHFIHHSLDVDDYDTNYGFIFTLWDKIFGTFKTYSTEHLSNNISTGIREYPRAQDLTFFKLLWMPFRSQKPDPKKEKQ